MQTRSPKGNPLAMREINLRLVRRALQSLGTATRHHLAQATGLSLVTVNALVQSLLATGEALEDTPIPSEGGRPSQVFRFHAGHSHVLVLFTRETDGNDTVYARVADLQGTVVGEEVAGFTPQSLADFEPLIDRALAEFPTIRALGFGLPGIAVGGVLVALDYPGLVGAPLVDHFRTRYGLPVIVENDVNAAVVGYGNRIEFDRDGSLVYLYFPRKYPPGAGVLVGGNLIRGRNAFAGEVSRLPLGIPWAEPGLVDGFDSGCAAVAAVVSSLVCVLNPELVVLQGEFLSPDHLAEVRRLCGLQVPPETVPNLALSQDFTRDFQAGIVAQTLAVLDSPFRSP